tara:strand:+ start:682 stop:1206 length:525 start_codon:yes stop_codon:yes gene_type:complete
MKCRAKKLPPFETVNEILNYNPKTGGFLWKVPRNSNRIKAGSIAGRINNNGYRYITIARRAYAAHRLAYLLMTGKDPWPYEIDHIEENNKSNNCWNNLRKATPAQNSANRKKGSNNTSGYKSITFMSSQRLNPWLVVISRKEKQYYLGSFPTIEKAIEERDKKGRELYGAFYNP